MNTSQPVTHFNVFTVAEFDAPTKEDANRKAKSCSKVGVAFPHKKGSGFNIELRAFPVNGRLVALPPNFEEQEPAPTREARACR